MNIFWSHILFKDKYRFKFLRGAGAEVLTTSNMIWIKTWVGEEKMKAFGHLTEKENKEMIR